MLVGCQEHVLMSQQAFKWTMANITLIFHNQQAQLQTIIST